MDAELSDNEKQTLAREVAADDHIRLRTGVVEVFCPECDDKFDAWPDEQVGRVGFIAGWDAAMEYVNAKT